MLEYRMIFKVESNIPQMHAIRNAMRDEVKEYENFIEIHSIGKEVFLKKIPCTFKNIDNLYDYVFLEIIERLVEAFVKMVSLDALPIIQIEETSRQEQREKPLHIALSEIVVSLGGVYNLIRGETYSIEFYPTIPFRYQEAFGIQTTIVVISATSVCNKKNLFDRAVLPLALHLSRRLLLQTDDEERSKAIYQKIARLYL